VPGGHVCVDDMRADETRAASNENLQWS
jgi:hypothetical protein